MEARAITAPVLMLAFACASDPLEQAEESGPAGARAAIDRQSTEIVSSLDERGGGIGRGEAGTH